MCPEYNYDYHSFAQEFCTAAFRHFSEQVCDSTIVCRSFIVCLYMLEFYKVLLPPQSAKIVTENWT